MSAKWAVRDVQQEELECELNAFAAQGYEIFELFRYDCLARTISGATVQGTVRFQIVARKPSYPSYRGIPGVFTREGE